MSKMPLLDLDGVIVNFIRPALKFHGRDDIKYEDIIWTIDEVLFPGNSIKFWEPFGYDFWAGLPWTDEGEELVRSLVDIFGWDNICLCTSPSGIKGSAEGKIEWIRRNIPKLSRNYMISPMKHAAASRDRILIDDNDHNCAKFSKAGGRVVLVPQPWNARKGEGFTVQSIMKEVFQQCLNGTDDS